MCTVILCTVVLYHMHLYILRLNDIKNLQGEKREQESNG